MYEDMSYGIIGRVVGAPFAVLVAEELFASVKEHMLYMPFRVSGVC